MNNNILKPKSPSRIWRKSRRKRPDWPELQPGQRVTLPGGGVLLRELPIKSRSKYSPK